MGVTAFAGFTRIAAGERREVVSEAKQSVDRGETVLVFNDATGEVVDLDYREAAEPRPDAEPERRAGRPKLGVVPREVTLLPRHWEWLNGQPGGASAALRRLVEQARRDNADRDRVRHSQEAAHRFLSAMAGNEPGYEEALRALFRGDAARFDECVAPWPADVRQYASALAAPALGRAA